MAVSPKKMYDEQEIRVDEDFVRGIEEDIDAHLKPMSYIPGRLLTISLLDHHIIRQSCVSRIQSVGLGEGNRLEIMSRYHEAGWEDVKIDGIVLRLRFPNYSAVEMVKRAEQEIMCMHGGADRPHDCRCRHDCVCKKSGRCGSVCCLEAYCSTSPSYDPDRKHM